jgi:hypothetical protein
MRKGETGLLLHSFLTSALSGGEKLTSIKYEGSLVKRNYIYIL